MKKDNGITSEVMTPPEANWFRDSNTTVSIVSDCYKCETL